MEKIASNINKILNKLSIQNHNEEYSSIKIEIESQSFTDCQSALNHFLKIANASGWICDTSSSEIIYFSKNQQINKEKIAWIIEGEAVSDDKNVSSRISQNQEGGWLVQTFTKSKEENSKEYLVKNVSLRKVQGGKMNYQIAYSLEGNKLFPAWQRLISITE